VTRPVPDSAGHTPAPVGIGEPVVDDEREEDPSLRDPLRRLSVRTLAIIAGALWVAALATLVIVLLLWHTPPVDPVQLG